MPGARYFLPDHPSLKDTYAKEDLRRLVQAGRLSRSEMVLDDETGLAHLLGDLLAAPYHGTSPPGRRAGGAREQSVDVEEFRAPTPLPRPESSVFRETGDDDDEFFQDDPATSPDEPGRDARRFLADEHTPEEKDFYESTPDPASLEPAPEELHYHGRPSWFSYPKSVLLIAAFIASALLCQRYGAGLIWTATCASLAGLTALLVMLNRTTTEYFVTSRRVEMESGIIGRNTKEIRISDIRAIDVTQRGWNGVVGVGTVEFFSAADEADVVFANVWRPHKVKERVRELQDKPQDQQDMRGW